MKKTMINKSHIEGFIYEHSLELKVSGAQSKNPGTEFIAGTLSVATDNACINIIPIHFTYVTATTSKGSANATFSVLKNIIDGKVGTIMKNGKDMAGKVRIDSALGLNEFYTDRDGKETFVSVKRNEGGFVHLVDVLVEDEKSRNTFECDILITGAVRQEANEEKGVPEKVIVKGAIFDFKKALLPVEFSAVNAGAMDYFEGLGASVTEPVFTKVWGRQISETIDKKITVESAFGDDAVKIVKNTHKDFVITGAAKEAYEFDTQETITIAELNEAVTARNTYVATIKQRNDEYKASKNESATPIATAGFNF